MLKLLAIGTVENILLRFDSIILKTEENKSDSPLKQSSRINTRLQTTPRNLFGKSRNKIKAQFFSILSPRFPFPTLLMTIKSNRYKILSSPSTPSVAKYLTNLLNRLQPDAETLVLIVALIIGGSSGLAMVLFHHLINWSQTLSFGRLLGNFSAWGGWTVALIPILGGVVVGGIKWFFPQVLGQDFHSLIRSTRIEAISPWRPGIKMLAASVSLGTGASLGPESPSVEIGSNIGIILGQLFQVSKERYRLLLGAGAAAGLSAGFNAPIAGVFFALEVVLSTAFTTPAASLILLSAFISAIVSRTFLGTHPAFDLPVFEVLSYWEWFYYLGLGLLASAIAFCYTQGIKLATACFKGEVAIFAWLGNLPIWIKPVVGGTILGVVALQFPRVLGVDYGTVEQILSGKQFSVTLLCWLLIIKLIVTAISLGSGFVGGVFAPALFLGACLGAIYGNFLNLVVDPSLTIAPPPAYAIVGMAAVLAGSVKAPLTAIALLFELTQNYLIILPVMAAVGVCVWVVGLIRDSQDTEGLNLQQMGMNLAKQNDEEVLQQVSVAEMMSTDYLALLDSLSVIEAGQKMLDKKCHTALVVDNAQQLVGIVSVADVKRNATEQQQQLKSICTSEILYTCPDEPVILAREKMGARGLYLLPVVDKNNPRQIIGTITKEQIELAPDLISTQIALQPYLSSREII